MRIAKQTLLILTLLLLSIGCAPKPDRPSEERRRPEFLINYYPGWAEIYSISESNYSSISITVWSQFLGIPLSNKTGQEVDETIRETIFLEVDGHLLSNEDMGIEIFLSESDSRTLLLIWPYDFEAGIHDVRLLFMVGDYMVPRFEWWFTVTD